MENKKSKKKEETSKKTEAKKTTTPKKAAVKKAAAPKKAVAKKAAVKKEKETTPQKLITLKKVGSNVIASINGDTYKRKFSADEKEKVDEYMKGVENYNKKNNASFENDLKAFLTPKETKQRDIEATRKSVKKQIEKEIENNKVVPKSRKELIKALDTDEELSLEDRQALQKLLDKGKKVNTEQPKAVTSPVRRSGEW